MFVHQDRSSTRRGRPRPFTAIVCSVAVLLCCATVLAASAQAEPECWPSESGLDCQQYKDSETVVLQPVTVIGIRPPVELPPGVAELVAGENPRAVGDPRGGGGSTTPTPAAPSATLSVCSLPEVANTTSASNSQARLVAAEKLFWSLLTPGGPSFGNLHAGSIIRVMFRDGGSEDYEYLALPFGRQVGHAHNLVAGSGTSGCGSAASGSAGGGGRPGGSGRMNP
jgi:hypothetical protein